jgi:hypothetical protein
MKSGGNREWISARMAAWLDVLAIDLLGYALMDNHIHVVVRSRPDVAHGWTPEEVGRRWRGLSTVSDGGPSLPEQAIRDFHLTAKELPAIRGVLAHPGAMLRAVKEGL